MMAMAIATGKIITNGAKYWDVTVEIWNFGWAFFLGWASAAMSWIAAALSIKPVNEIGAF